MLNIAGKEKFESYCYTCKKYVTFVNEFESPRIRADAFGDPFSKSRRWSPNIVEDWGQKVCGDCRTSKAKMKREQIGILEAKIFSQKLYRAIYGILFIYLLLILTGVPYENKLRDHKEYFWIWVPPVMVFGIWSGVSWLITSFREGDGWNPKPTWAEKRWLGRELLRHRIGYYDFPREEVNYNTFEIITGIGQRRYEVLLAVFSLIFLLYSLLGLMLQNSLWYLITLPYFLLYISYLQKNRTNRRSQMLEINNDEQNQPNEVDNHESIEGNEVWNEHTIGLNIFFLFMVLVVLIAVLIQFIFNLFENFSIDL